MSMSRSPKESEHRHCAPMLLRPSATQMTRRQISCHGMCMHWRNLSDRFSIVAHVSLCARRQPAHLTWTPRGVHTKCARCVLLSLCMCGGVSCAQATPFSLFSLSRTPGPLARAPALSSSCCVWPHARFHPLCMAPREAPNLAPSARTVSLANVTKRIREYRL